MQPRDSYLLTSTRVERIGEPYTQKWPLLKTTQIRELENLYSRQRSALCSKFNNSNKAQSPVPTLMESAGISLAKLCIALAPDARDIWIACGPGNNGADGLVAAIELQKMGKKAYVSLITKDNFPKTPSSTTYFADIDDQLSAQQAAISAGIELHTQAPKHWDFAIDALLGIGLDARHPRPIEGLIADWLSLINTASAPVLCVDTPSGLCTDTGGMSLIACPPVMDLRPLELNSKQIRYTLTFLGLKPGLFTNDGKDFCGELWFAPLTHDGLVAHTTLDFENHNSHIYLNSAPAVTQRLHNTHKGTYADAIILGGASGMQGAAVLASTAALHMGAGRVYLCLIEDTTIHIRINPALMSRSAKDIENLHLESATVVCGCGAGTEINKYLQLVLTNASNLVLDADALNAVATETSFQDLLKARFATSMQTVLTPHPLEAARLLGITTREIQSNRIESAQKLAQLFKCTVVLKGAGSVIAEYGNAKHQSELGNTLVTGKKAGVAGRKALNSKLSQDPKLMDRITERICVNPTGCALLASAGTGDVLAGMIGALLARSGDAWSSACEAVFLHGLTAQKWNLHESFDAELLAQRVSYPRLRN